MAARKSPTKLKDWSASDLEELGTGVDAFQSRQTGLALYDRMLASPSPERQQATNGGAAPDPMSLTQLARRISTQTGPAIGLFERLAPMGEGVDGDLAVRDALESDLLIPPNKEILRLTIERLNEVSSSVRFSTGFSTDRLGNMIHALAAHDEQLRSDLAQLERGIRPNDPAVASIAGPGASSRFEGGMASVVGGAVVLLAAGAAIATAPIWIVAAGGFLGGALIGWGAVMVHDALWDEQI